MYENVKNFLVEKGYKKHKASSLLYVRDDILFTLSPQGVKNDINIWYAIFPLALPNLWINMGWSPAAGSFPKNGSFPNNQGEIDSLMIDEIKSNIFPFFSQCKSLKSLEQLYSQGNIKAQYPRIFALLSIKEYIKAQALIDKVIYEFKDRGIGTIELETLKKFSSLKDQSTIDDLLEEERKKNIKKYSLARHIQNSN